MLCIEVSGLLKFYIFIVIESLLEHNGCVLILQGICQDSVVGFQVVVFLLNQCGKV